MSTISRRSFVRTIGSALPALAMPTKGADGADRIGSAGLDPERLRALSAAVLPEELGEEGMARATAGFATWLEAYEAGAEVNHPYGASEIEQLPESPGPRWASQLDTLNKEASRRFNSSFTALDVARRRELLRRELAGEPAALPAPHTARHVAVGLLAWFCATPEATDLCYRARIGKETCRPLNGTVNEPTARSELR
jgi:hypothetical protein